MSDRLNRRWVTAKRPVGEPTDDCFELPGRNFGKQLVRVKS